jgi:hypothetical protein
MIVDECRELFGIDLPSVGIHKLKNQSLYADDKIFKQYTVESVFLAIVFFSNRINVHFVYCLHFLYDLCLYYVSTIYGEKYSFI